MPVCDENLSGSGRKNPRREREGCLAGQAQLAFRARMGHQGCKALRAGRVSRAPSGQWGRPGRPEGLVAMASRGLRASGDTAESRGPLASRARQA